MNHKDTIGHIEGT